MSDHPTYRMPNNRLQVTGNSLRSYAAPAAPRA